MRRLAPVRAHWPEYAIEAAGLATFMVSASLFATLLEHPASPVRAALDVVWQRRVLMGAAMGLTLMAIVYSPFGRRSGAHLNPAFTLAFYRLGRIDPRDATAYPVMQVVGGAFGITIAALLLGPLLADPAVHFVTTMPGPAGVAWAFVAEATISALLMTVVLHTAASARLAPYTGVIAGLCVATFIAVEAPISGMSMNPARTLASALGGRSWDALWLYFTAPPLGMLAAAWLYARQSADAIPCAKYRHVDGDACIFCDFAGLPTAPPRVGNHSAVPFVDAATKREHIVPTHTGDRHDT